MTLRVEISVSGVYLDEHMSSIGKDENLCSDRVNYLISNIGGNLTHLIRPYLIGSNPSLYES